MTPSHPVAPDPLPVDVALVTFDDVNKAVEEYAAAGGRAKSGDRWQDQVGFVEHHEDDHLVLRGTFAGRYVDVDEAAHISEEGAARGLRTGALAGLLLTPAGFAVGSVFGAVVGSHEGEPSEREREPTLLAEKLRSAIPAPGSAVVLAADADVVDSMLSAFAASEAQVTRATLSEDQVAVLEVALSDQPAA